MSGFESVIHHLLTWVKYLYFIVHILLSLIMSVNDCAVSSRTNLLTIECV